MAVACGLWSERPVSIIPQLFEVPVEWLNERRAGETSGPPSYKPVLSALLDTTTPADPRKGRKHQNDSSCRNQAAEPVCSGDRHPGQRIVLEDRNLVLPGRSFIGAVLDLAVERALSLIHI